MPSNPLTHHDILSLIEPFTRAGRHLDLPASNRLERRLVFKPMQRPLVAPQSPALRDTLQLDNPKANVYRLTRTLAWRAGLNERLEARLEIEGEHPGDLLASVDLVAPERQFRFGPGFAMARSYRLVRGEDAAPGAPPVGRLRLTQASARVEGLLVSFTAPKVKGDADGDIELRAGAPDFITLPDDLLAVLGWDWGLLDRRRDRWTSSLRIRGNEPERSRGAECKLDLMVEHLAQTLGDAPARFHERLAGARWRVMLRRAIPLLAYAGVIGAALASSRLDIAENSPARLLILNAPPLLLMAIFCMRRLPRIEIPPVPRRSNASDWRETTPAPLPVPSQSQSPLRPRSFR